MKDLVYSKELYVAQEPTKAQLEEAYNTHKTEGVKDFIVTTILHMGALRFLKNGAFKEPGTYVITVRIPMPIMLWKSARYSIRKL